MDSVHCQNVKLYENYDFEKNLVTSSVFQNARLRLYCNVPVTDLFLPGQPEGDASDSRIDYLICRGTSRLLAVTVTDRVPQHCLDRLRPLPIITISGKFDESLYPTVVQWLQKSGLSRIGYYSPHSIPTEVAEQLEAAWILDREGPGNTRVPTAFGKHLGIVRGYYAQGGGLYRCQSYWSDRTNDRVKAALSASVYTPDESNVIPLATRLSRVKQALPSTERYSAVVARRFAQYPLNEYMSAYPEQLARLNAAFRDPPATIQDAAVRIYDLFQNKITVPKARELMLLLAFPMVQKIKISKGEV